MNTHLVISGKVMEGVIHLLPEYSRSRCKVNGKMTGIIINHETKIIKVQIGDGIDFSLDDCNEFDGNMQEFLQHSLNEYFRGKEE